MNKKGIKKYYPGVNGLTTGASANTYGVLAPEPSSGTPLIDNLIKKSMTSEGFKETMPKEKGPSFEDKAGNVLSKSGGILGMLAPLLIKKPDPNERPYKKGTNMIKTKKRNLIKYQAGTEDLIGPGPLDNLSEMSPEQLKAFNAYENKKEIAEAIARVNPMTAPISPLTPKMASLRMPQEAPMSPRLNKVPVEKQSRRERKAENERLFKMVRKDESPIEPLMPKMAKLSPEIPAMQPSLKKVEVETPSKRPKFFDYHSAEAKGGYSRALKSGIKTKEGWLTDPETGLVYKDLRNQKGKNATAKPLVKMKEDSWTPQQWKEFSDNRKKEMSLVNKEEAYRKNPNSFWKDVQGLRKSTMGKNFDRGQTSNNVVESPKKFSMNDIMLKKKELSELRSKVPGFGPFRRSEDAKTVEKIDYINSKLYKLSQQEAAYERRKKRGEANKQAEIEAQERAKEFNRLTKDLKI